MVCREMAEDLGLRIHSGHHRQLGYEIAPSRHVFIANYEGDEDLSPIGRAQQLGVFAYDDVPGLRMPEPYKVTIARWHDRTRGLEGL